MTGSMLHAMIFIVSAGTIVAFGPVFIPPDAPLTRVNDSENRLLHRLCGISEGREYPWSVSIMRKGRNKLGGTIISPYHIITAAHGFVRFDNSAPGECQIVGYRRYWSLHDRVVAFGDDCIRERQGARSIDTSCNRTSVQFRRIRAILVDHGFAEGGCMNGHDWAIVELDQPIHFDSRVRPICLPYLGQPVHSRLKAVGWGKADAFTNGDARIREIPLVHDPDCKAPWSDSMPTKIDDYICAKAVNPRDHNSPRTCHGDSGSGLEQRDADGLATLVGVTSFGSRGCPANELGRFTRVEKYLDPICKYTGVCYSIGGRK